MPPGCCRYGAYPPHLKHDTSGNAAVPLYQKAISSEILLPLRLLGPELPLPPSPIPSKQPQGQEWEPEKQEALSSTNSHFITGFTSNLSVLLVQPH